MAEMERRKWNNAELARRAEIGHSTVSMVLSGQSRPGLDFCIGIGRAFGLPPEKVLRIAGLLPSIPPVEDSSIQRLIDLARLLSPSERQLVTDFAEWRYQRSQTEKS